MIIGIEINDVIRAFTKRFGEVYTKYYLTDGMEIDLIEEPITSGKFSDYFKFSTIDDYNAFIYTDCAMEVNGLAPELHEHSVTKLNALNLDLLDDEEHEIVLVSREANLSIPATMYFLSKLSTKIRHITLTPKYDKLWDNVDVMIAAQNETILAKPKDKVVVKVKTSYNEDIDSDFTIDSIVNFIENAELREEILNKKK